MPPKIRRLYYGDNLEVLNKKVLKESVDLCYIDPPFNSKRAYHMIYLGEDERADQAQVQAFTDTWTWGPRAEEEYESIMQSSENLYTEATIRLVEGLCRALRKTSLLAYLVSMATRMNTIWSALKPTGSFYLHCDPTASHYLKLLLDSIFLPRGGDFKNEMIWYYKNASRGKQRFAKSHDIIFWYSKSHHQYTFNRKNVLQPFDSGMTKWRYTQGGQKGKPVPEGKTPDDVITMPSLNTMSKERLGYPTQKPEALLERIIKASSNKGDVVLDAYCGCGTTVAVAERLDRQWIGIDITYQSISLVLKRLKDRLALSEKKIVLDGIPKEMAAAQALATKKDDRLRKEFEKWAVLTFTDNKGRVNEQKGADKGIDGRFTFMDTDPKGKACYKHGVLQVKSGKVGRSNISAFLSDMQNDGAELGYFITLEPPTKNMLSEAAAAGFFTLQVSKKKMPRLRIVTVAEMLKGARIDALTLKDQHRSAAFKGTGEQARLSVHE